ncbi:MAG: TusE/DsrC/DsvC family sulfur relay protein [Hyphomicrobiaceae bacterium]|nr:TusE/DsrC/DsvC family sulfur relay protein [Hyphomicrobiaceae bacterium]
MSEIDINKVLAAGTDNVDPLRLARSSEITGSSSSDVEARAVAEGIELTKNHWKVIEMLRALYIERGLAPHARLIAALLADEFAEEGGSKYLYQLFPGGPVAQGSRLAGVPSPHDTQDRSFGSTY